MHVKGLLDGYGADVKIRIIMLNSWHAEPYFQLLLNRKLQNMCVYIIIMLYKLVRST